MTTRAPAVLTNLGSKEQGNNMATNHHTGPWHFVEFKALAEKNYCDKIELLKNTDLQRYLSQSHIGSMIGLWNITLVNASLHWCSYFPSHLCHLVSSKELISQQVLSDRRLHLMLVGTSTYGAAGKFQRLPPINIQQHRKIRFTWFFSDSWTVTRSSIRMNVALVIKQSS